MSQHTLKKWMVEKLADVGQFHIVAKVGTPGLVVPPDDWGDAVVMNFSRKFGTSLVIGSGGVEQRLSFQGKDFDVFVPWEAVFAVGAGAAEHKLSEKAFFPQEAVPATEPEQTKRGLRVVN